MTEVVFAPVWVWWVFGETITLATGMGGVLIMAAVLVQARAREIPSESPPNHPLPGFPGRWGRRRPAS